MSAVGPLFNRKVHLDPFLKEDIDDQVLVLIPIRKALFYESF